MGRGGPPGLVRDWRGWRCSAPAPRGTGMGGMRGAPGEVSPSLGLSRTEDKGGLRVLGWGAHLLMEL